MITYTKNSLQIEIPKGDAAGHEYLMLSIITAIRLAIICPDDGTRRAKDLQNLVPLLDMLIELLPGEFKLEKAYHN